MTSSSLSSPSSGRGAGRFPVMMVLVMLASGVLLMSSSASLEEGQEAADTVS